MNIRDYVPRYYGNGYNCAEAILLAANDYRDFQLTTEEVRMMGGFGGGMAVESTCGVVTGGVAAISRIMIKTRSHETRYLRKTVSIYIKAFEEALESSQCSHLKPEYYREEKGCLETVLLGADILQKVLDEIK